MVNLYASASVTHNSLYINTLRFMPAYFGEQA